MPTKSEFTTVAATELETVAGGASRVASRNSSNSDITQLLTQVTGSIKDLAKDKNSGSDPMQMMMMMMMMGGGGGGGGAAAAAAPAPAPAPTPVAQVSVKCNC